MKSNIIDFYYFSGTGNTLLVIKKMRETFERNGITVNLFRLEKVNPKELNFSHTIGFAFPVAIQSTYEFIWDFFKVLPQASGTEVFMVDTLLCFSGAIVGPLKKYLKKKGYSPIGAKEIHMPSNLYPKKVDERKNGKIVAKGLKQAEEYAEDIINRKSKWRRFPVLSDAFYFLMTKKMWWRYMAELGKKFTVDKAKCIRCGLCARLCPVGNIKLDEYPVFSDKCEQCMRCVMFCPEGAIVGHPGWEYRRYRAVDAQELLK